MSAPSPREFERNAHISTKALETLQRRNNSVSEILSAHFRCTRVIDTPMRMLEVVEHKHEGTMFLRYTEWRGAGKVFAHIIPLDYHEAQALASTLRELEQPPEKTKR